MNSLVGATTVSLSEMWAMKASCASSESWLLFGSVLSICLKLVTNIEGWIVEFCIGIYWLNCLFNFFLIAKVVRVL